ncbi:MAG: type II toxin-antitoxin system RelE family toxin [Bacillota bacterium]
MFEIKLTSSAARYYKKVDSRTKKSLNICFENLKVNPESHSNIKKLHGELKGLHRYRLGKIRIVYRIEKNDNVVVILAIAPRGSIYKGNI